jgi:GTPase
MRCAAALLHAAHAEAGAAGGAEGAAGAGGYGSVVQARLRFAHRPEWLREGSRIIVRDRADGHVAAAGLVRLAACG